MACCTGTIERGFKVGGIVFLFPGQGSQKIGMGKDFYEAYDFVRELFDMAEEISGLNLSRLCFQGPLDELTQTANLQPAVTTVNLAALTAIAKEGVQCDIAAGHSMGEYSALYAAGFLSKEDTFKLVFKRGELMQREATKHQGAMHAVIGLDIEAVNRLVTEEQRKGVVSVANHNTESQIVITGAPDSVQRVSNMAVSQGAKAVPLKVSGAWHSQLIEGAENEFNQILNAIPFNTPHSAIIHNVTAELSRDPKESQAIMADQLCSPVKWYDAMRRTMAEEISIFVEIGPGKVLSGLLKKILPRDYPCKLFAVNDMHSLERFLKEVT